MAPWLESHELIPLLLAQILSLLLNLNINLTHIPGPRQTHMAWIDYKIRDHQDMTALTSQHLLHRHMQLVWHQLDAKERICGIWLALLSVSVLRMRPESRL
jgi:hypothetical protein